MTLTTNIQPRGLDVLLPRYLSKSLAQIQLFGFDLPYRKEYNSPHGRRARVLQSRNTRTKEFSCTLKPVR